MASTAAGGISSLIELQSVYDTAVTHVVSDICRSMMSRTNISFFFGWYLLLAITRTLKESITRNLKKSIKRTLKKSITRTPKKSITRTLKESILRTLNSEEIDYAHFEGIDYAHSEGIDYAHSEGIDYAQSEGIHHSQYFNAFIFCVYTVLSNYFGYYSIA